MVISTQINYMAVHINNNNNNNDNSYKTMSVIAIEVSAYLD